MAIFKTTNHKGITFTRDARVVRNPYNKGWVIEAFSNDADLYAGRYVKSVGFADETTTRGNIAFKYKRDAIAAMKEAIGLGILKTEGK